MCKSLGMLPCSGSAGCMHCSRTDQVAASDSVRGVEWSSCGVCVEENKKCNCGDECDSGTGVKGVLGEKEVLHKTNSSFLHAVVNMIGMLIGN